ncbi:MAG: carbon monoxide dehydrogenase, partial [Bacillota bacterium]
TGVILRGDSFMELGNPEAGSAAITLFTDDVSLINNGKITLLGPDIPEAAGASLPFGQIVLIGGKNLQPSDHDRIQAAGIVSDFIEGYMVRSMSGCVWSRVSKDAAAKGFDFTTLGQALMALYRQNCPDIEAMEIVFLTANAAAVRELGGIATQIQKITREMVKENWAIRGYDIDCANDCSSCGDKIVCDDIREVLKIRTEASKEQGANG